MHDYVYNILYSNMRVRANAYYFSFLMNDIRFYHFQMCARPIHSSVLFRKISKY